MTSNVNEIHIRKQREAWRYEAWTSTPNHLLLRSDITWKAKGVFAWLSLAADDPDFDVTGNGVAAAGTDGRDEAQAILRELEQHGYLTRHRVPVPGKASTDVVYTLWPKPVDEHERTYRPSAARKRKSAFSQRKPQKLNVQALGDEQGNVHNSTAPDRPVEYTPDEDADVFAAQAPKTERAGPTRAGPTRAGLPTSSPERSSSSSLGSSVTAETVGSATTETQEEEVRSAEEENPEAAALLDASVRFKPGRYLRAEARERCVELLATHRVAGWSDERLAELLREWSAQALNPTTYLPEKLGGLSAPAMPAPARRPAGERPAERPPAATEATRQRAMREMRSHFGRTDTA